MKTITTLYLLLLPSLTMAADCRQLLSTKVANLDDLSRAFSGNLRPDLSDPQQESALLVYLQLHFKSTMSNERLRSVLKILETYEDIRKKPLRNFLLQTTKKVAPVSQELQTVSSSWNKSAAKVRANLFYVGTNQGYWEKMLGKAGAKFLLAELPNVPRPKELYQSLAAARKLLADTRRISQAMVDIVHTIGHHDKELRDALKSADGLERLAAIKSMLAARETFAKQLGFEQGFSQLLGELAIPYPTGLTENNKIDGLIRSLEDSLAPQEGIISVRTIRHLSIVESPFRGCLGEDCSTEYYPSKALDPNYHYFTLTDQQFDSRGHVTVVLGKAKDTQEKPVKVAFVDKIQNIDNADLPAMLEGIRQSLKEQGYVLALPDEIGDHNGLSNQGNIRNFVLENIPVNYVHGLTDFRPHPRHTEFHDDGNFYSRAEDNLTMNPILPLPASSTTKVVPADINRPWSIKELNMNRIFSSIVQLKNGNTKDRINYIKTIERLKLSGFDIEPEYHSIVKTWVKDKSLPFKLRKEALFSLFVNDKNALFPLFEHFLANEQTVIFQNILDTLRYNYLLPKDNLLFQLTALENPKIIGLLGRNNSYYFRPSKERSPLNFIHDSQDINIQKALVKVYLANYHLFFHGHPIFDGHQLNDIIADNDQTFFAIVNILKQIDTIDFSSRFSNSDNTKAFRFITKLRKAPQEAGVNFILDELLFFHLSHSSKEEKRIGVILNEVLYKSVLDEHEKPLYQRIIGQMESSIYTDIFKLFFQEKLPGPYDALVMWMKSDAIDAQKKGMFLLHQFDLARTYLKKVFPNFTGLMDIIPAWQRPQVEQVINQKWAFPLFSRLANKKGISLFPEQYLSQTEVLSFGFDSHFQRGPVTNLQWSLVMGKDFSEFVQSPSAPHLALIVHSAQAKREFVRRLNKEQNDYTYRASTLPAMNEGSLILHRIPRAQEEASWGIATESAKLAK